MIHALLILMLHLNRCSAPAPTTASAYTQLWSTLDDSQWGAADVSISVSLPDGRVAWLYGDTLSTRGMVHQTAIIQDRGCLHIANEGSALMGDTTPHDIYWIESAHWDHELIIQFRAIHLTGSGTWDFKDSGYSMQEGFTITSTGDLMRDYSIEKRIVGPEVAGGALGSDRPHHYTYAMHSHPEAHLKSGAMLYTTCQNWDDGKHPLADYRPIFTEGIPA